MNKTGYPSIDKIHLAGIPEEKLHPRIIPASIYATFCQINAERMSDVAILDGDLARTKLSVKDDAETLGNALITIGVSKGDCVTFVTKNCYESIVAMMAANMIGARIAVLNNLDKPIEIVRQAKLFETKIMFVTDCSNTTMEHYLGEIPTLRWIMPIERGICRGRNPDGKIMNYNDLYMCGSEQSRLKLYVAAKDNAMNEDVCLYLQTSGSKSGKPKILPFTNRAIFASLIYASNSTGTKTNDSSVNKVLCVLPFRLPYGWMTIFVNLMGGNTVVLSGTSLTDIRNYHALKPSYIYGTPIIFKQFTMSTPNNADLSSITAFFCSGFSMGEEWYEEGIKYLRAHNSQGEIRNNYGIGEGLCIGTASDGIPHKPGTSGKFYVGPNWRLVDENLNEVRYGEVGEAIVWSESLCQGYYANPEDTAKAFLRWKDGRTYYRTGDMLVLDMDGYVTYVGRKERFFQPVGAPDKVNCRTIEDALTSIDGVRNAAVIIAHNEAGLEYGHAYIEASVCISLDDIRLKLAETLLEYQMPSKITVLEALPVMESGKVNYAKLTNL